MIGQKVYVYRNLHKGCWSIRSVKTRRVIAHAFCLVLVDCVFKVSQKGRERVIREKSKNVHAGVEGFLYSINNPHCPAADRISYNPYHLEYFKCNDTPIHCADKVYFTEKGAFK